MINYVAVGFPPSSNKTSLMYAGGVKGTADKKNCIAVWDLTRKIVIWLDISSSAASRNESEFNKQLLTNGLNRTGVVFGCGDITACQGVGTYSNAKKVPKCDISLSLYSEELVNPTSSARLRINIGPGLTKNINMQIPMAAIHLDSFGRDIEAKEGKHGPGASYSASMMTNQGLIYIDVVFWSPSDIRQYLTLDTTYIVYDGKLKYTLAKGDDTQWPATFNVGSNSVVMEGDPENFTGIFAEGASRDVDTYNTNLTATYKNVVVVQTTLGESTRAGGDIYNVDLIEQDSGKVVTCGLGKSLVVKLNMWWPKTPGNYMPPGRDGDPSIMPAQGYVLAEVHLRMGLIERAYREEIHSEKNGPDLVLYCVDEDTKIVSSLKDIVTPGVAVKTSVASDIKGPPESVFDDEKASDDMKASDDKKTSFVISGGQEDDLSIIKRKLAFPKDEVVDDAGASGSGSLRSGPLTRLQLTKQQQQGHKNEDEEVLEDQDVVLVDKEAPVKEEKVPLPPLKKQAVADDKDKPNKAVKPFGGKTYDVEAFIKLGYDEDTGNALVLVKYTDYDDAEWQPVKFMKDELSKGYFDLLMKTMNK